MMPFERALSIAQRDLPDRMYTGFAYKHKTDYYIEMAPIGIDSMPMDCIFKIDGNYATITRYNPIIDGIIPANEMELI